MLVNTMLICGSSQQVHPRSIPIHTVFNEDEQEFFQRNTSLKTNHQVPIYTLDGEGDGMCYGDADTIDWHSWDTFIRSLVLSKLLVKKNDCLYPRQLSYERGFLVIKSLFDKKVVCVKGIRSCVRVGMGVVIDTVEYGELSITFSEAVHVLAFSKVISGFVTGLYDNNLE